MSKKAAFGFIFSAIFILIVFVLFITGAFSCQKTSAEALQRSQKITLNYWGVDDSSGAFDKIISSYRALHPHITITYRKFRAEEYEQALIEAWASDRGPDIFLIPNTWLDKYLRKGYLKELPAKISMPYITAKAGGCQQSDTIVIKEKSSTSLKNLKDKFVDVVTDDVVRDSKIYALPYSVETLALFYNRDLLNNANIPNPAENWNDFLDQVKKLTIQDASGNILQSGVSMGTAKNIPYSTDILTTLMLQNGVVMSSNKKATFTAASAEDQGYYPGVEALKFYTSFSNPAKEVYTWNSSQIDAFSAFAAGKVAFFFGYPSDVADFKSKAPKLNFGVAEVPQIPSLTRRANYANYWLNVVSFKTKYTQEAWDFIQFATAAENVSTYLSATGKPTALRSLISSQLEDLYQAAFAQQVLSAKSWYSGINYPAVEDAFTKVIEDVNNGSVDYAKVLNNAANKINQTF